MHRELGLTFTSQSLKLVALHLLFILVQGDAGHSRTITVAFAPRWPLEHFDEHTAKGQKNEASAYLGHCPVAADTVLIYWVRMMHCGQLLLAALLALVVAKMHKMSCMLESFRTAQIQCQHHLAAVDNWLGRSAVAQLEGKMGAGSN